MDEDELLEMYESGRLDSTQVLMSHRQEILEYTDQVVPMRPGDVAEWWEDHKPVVAKQLGGEEEESDSESDQE